MGRGLEGLMLTVPYRDCFKTSDAEGLLPGDTVSVMVDDKEYTITPIV